jgi:hypothetical protein
MGKIKVMFQSTNQKFLVFSSDFAAVIFEPNGKNLGS